MAEGLLRHLAGDQFAVYSAGTHPSTVNPLAIAVRRERDIDISGHTSKSLTVYLDQSFEFVITVCDSAAEACPMFPGPGRRIHWSFPDPAAVGGNESERLAAFRDVRDAIERQLADWLREQPV